MAKRLIAQKPEAQKETPLTEQEIAELRRRIKHVGSGVELDMDSFLEEEEATFKRDQARHLSKVR